MQSYTFALIIALLASSASADITLIREGRPQVVIIVPDGLGKPVHLPAEKRYLRMARSYAEREVE